MLHFTIAPAFCTNPYLEDRFVEQQGTRPSILALVRLLSARRRAAFRFVHTFYYGSRGCCRSSEVGKHPSWAYRTNYVRSIILFWMCAVLFISSLVGSVVGAILLHQNLVLPFIITPILILMRLFVIYIMPESKMLLPLVFRARQGVAVTSDPNSREYLDVGRSGTEQYSANNNLAQLVTYLRSSRPLKFCVAAFFLKRVAFSSETVVYQYASELLHIRIDQTVWFRLLQGMGATAVTLFVSPMAVYWGIRKGVAPLHIDIWSARSYLGILVVGFTVLFFSTDAVSLSLGKAQPYVQQSSRTDRDDSTSALRFRRRSRALAAVVDFQIRPTTLIQYTLCRSWNGRHYSQARRWPYHG